MNSIQQAAERLARGEIVLVSDDVSREDEGDLILAAEHATPEKIAFILRHSSGILCVPMTAERLQKLQLPLMVTQNTDPHRTAFTVSVDAREGVTTGISSEDRSRTIRLLADDNAKPEDFTRPGHIFPLMYREGGTLKRAGHTEASLDLMQIAGLKAVAVIGEVVKDDGCVARGKELSDFALQHGLIHVTVADLIRFRRQKERLVARIGEASLPTEFGAFRALVYRSSLDEIEHMALVFGTIDPSKPTLVRVHSECLTGDVFGSRRCDCGLQLKAAQAKIAEEGSGVIVYLRGHEGRGIGLGHKMRAYSLQDDGLDTVEANERLGFPADSREYGIGAQILADLGVTSMRVMTNNPAKYGGLEGYGLEIVERVPLIAAATEESRKYLETKQTKMGHLLCT